MPRNLMVEEGYVNLNALLTPSDSWALAAEANLIQHLSSRAYADSIRDRRWEAALGPGLGLTVDFLTRCVPNFVARS